MTSEPKSVTYHEDVSMAYLTDSDDLSSPPDSPPAPELDPVPELDPWYLEWLRVVTKAHYPFIVNGTLSRRIYCQNFEEYVRTKREEDAQRAKQKEAAVRPLVEKYGSLGWGSIYRIVNEEAWVHNYRALFRFAGSRQQLLEKMAEAFAEMKCTIAKDEKPSAEPTDDPQWRSYSLIGEPVNRPDRGPTVVNIHFSDAACAPPEGEGAIWFTSNSKDDTKDILSALGFGSEDSAPASPVPGEMCVFNAGNGQSRLNG